MQPNPLNILLYRELAKDLQGLGRERGVKFTRYSERLIVLAAEAWFGDPTPSNWKIPKGQNSRRRLAAQIFREALNDPHVKEEMERDGRVSFGTLWVSISDAAKQIIKKGL